jgi:hypothetical protein
VSDFLSKLENFLFDILGLILPGAIFLLILLSPVLFIDIKLAEPVADKSTLLAALTIVYGFLKDYCIHYPRTALFIATISAYLVGHTVKVFSRIKYEFLKALFDKNINPWAKKRFAKLKTRLFKNRLPPRWLREFYFPCKKLIKDIFQFETTSSNERDVPLRRKCVEEINERLSMNLPDSQENVAKMSSVITNQEGLRSLGTFYLAKYNLYRSLALIFLFTTLYYIYFFTTAGPVITEKSHRISGIILVAPAILWFTFHSKFKRYWTQYGDERIITLFYFLNKKKINEG